MSTALPILPRHVFMSGQRELQLHISPFTRQYHKDASKREKRTKYPKVSFSTFERGRKTVFHDKFKKKVK